MLVTVALEPCMIVNSIQPLNTYLIMWFTMVLYYGNLNPLHLHGENIQYHYNIERATKYYYEMPGTDKAEATMYNLNQINSYMYIFQDR